MDTIKCPCNIKLEQHHGCFSLMEVVSCPLYVLEVVVHAPSLYESTLT
jgi:hypothetical protein